MNQPFSAFLIPFTIYQVLTRQPWIGLAESYYVTSVIYVCHI